MRRTAIAVLALVAVVTGSWSAGAQSMPGSQESPWATRAPATPVPGTGHARVNTIHINDVAITQEQQALADEFVDALLSKDPAKMRALMPPTTLECFDKSSQPFLDDWIQKQLRHPVPNDHRVTVSELPSNVFKSSKMETYPVPATHLLEFKYSSDGRTVVNNQLIGREGGRWYLTPSCPTDAGMERFAKIEKMRANANQRAESLYPQLQEPLRSQLTTLIARHDNANALKLCMKSMHVDYLTARALIAKLTGAKPDDR